MPGDMKNAFNIISEDNNVYNLHAKNNVFKLPLETSYQDLKDINNIKLTHREIDVLACIANGRISTKTIASFLSIEPKTVEVYIRSIRVKLGCNSRESIVQYIEKAKKYLATRKHYFFLLSQFAFEQKLEKISSLMSQQNFSCAIIYEKQYQIFAEQLQKYFKNLGFEGKFIIKEINEKLENSFQGLNSQPPDHCLFIVSSQHFKQILINITPLPEFLKNLENITAISVREEPETKIFQEMCETYSIAHISFGKPESYYLSFFDLFKRLFSDIALDKIILEFKEQYSSTFQNSLFLSEGSAHSNEVLPPRKNIEYNSNEKTENSQNIIYNPFKELYEKIHIILILSLIVLVRDIAIRNEDSSFLNVYLQNCPLWAVWCCTLIFCFSAIIALYKRFQIEGLYLYNATVMIIANIYVTKFELCNLLVTSTFLVNNLLSEFHGRKIAQISIWFTVYAQLFIIMLVLLVVGYKEPTDSETQNYIYLSSIKTFTASLMAFMFSQWLNTLMFDHLPCKPGVLNLWLRMVISVFFMGLIDSFSFEYLDHSLLAQKAIQLHEVITNHITISFIDQIMFAIASIVICQFFCMKINYDRLKPVV